MQTGDLVQIIQTSQFSPASPDPAGVVYLDSINGLFTVDSEVDEMQLFDGSNLFASSLTGNLIYTGSTLSFSKEPTGVDVNPLNNHLFIADDDQRKIYEIAPGADGQYGNADDSIVRTISTTSFGSNDPEGIAFAPDLGTLFVVDGLNERVYQISTSGQLISQFSTANLGLLDPEGIEYDDNTGHLFLVGQPPGSLFEVTTSGALVQVINISAANPDKPAGLTIGPSSVDPTRSSIYISDRGVDNNDDPDENDGRIYEIYLGRPIGSQTNQAPLVNAGADQSVTALTASLNATITDDGLPNGSITSTWSLVSGPGSATFTNPNAEDTTVTFSTTGTYVLQLAASDGTLSTTDQVTVTVQPANPNPQNLIYVAAASSGTVGGITYADEDILVFDATTNTWSLHFDGSDVGLSNFKVDAFHIEADGSILLSFNDTVTLPDVSTVADSDIVRFTPTSTGPTTAGTWSFFFDGSDVGLTTAADDVRALGFAPDGRLLITTKATPSFLAGARDEDILAFNATSLGANTVGTWEVYFDGSTVGLDGSERIDSMWLNSNGDIYLSNEGVFSVPGLSGDGNDVFVFTPTSLGLNNTSGSYSLFWDANTYGFTSELTGFQVVTSGM